MAVNAENGGMRKFIMVQLPEEVEPSSTRPRPGTAILRELAKERIRRAGKSILESE